MEIFTEDANLDQWQMLLRFRYEENIRKYFSSSHACSPRQSIVDGICAAVLQAHEYFRAAESVSLNTSPLLYYYGTTNLLFAVSTLLNGLGPEIGGHGMGVVNAQQRSNRFADTEVTSYCGRRGAFNVYLQSFNRGFEVEKYNWTLLEILGSIPELKTEFHSCYPDEDCYVIPVQTVRLEHYFLDRILTEELDRWKDKSAILNRVNDLHSSYLDPYSTGEYIILNHRLGVEAQDTGIYSISGQRFLEVSHPKGGSRVTLPVLLYYFMGLFVLGYISRYNPVVWTQFIRTDSTGELHLIEQFIRSARRVIPNLALNAICGKRVCFVASSVGIVDLSETLSRDEVRNLIREEIDR